MKGFLNFTTVTNFTSSLTLILINFLIKHLQFVCLYPRECAEELQCKLTLCNENKTETFIDIYILYLVKHKTILSTHAQGHTMINFLCSSSILPQGWSNQSVLQYFCLHCTIRRQCKICNSIATAKPIFFQLTFLLIKW